MADQQRVIAQKRTGSTFFAVAAQAAAVVLVIALALWCATKHCEGIGCLGVGLVWMVWAVLYAVVLVTGLLLRRRACGHDAVARASLWAHIATGMVAAAYWVLR
ncbi:hypothetical protein [uncultured Zoogloea sp.]|uniref:hypothetical protein n=1 Tax=uncultured Zoogloea sp. TaxID=160237 RepID=UPI0026078BF7|nr:hypothetical protein [uncultured Zoogloea sp.]